MQGAIIAMGMLMAIVFGYLMAEPISLWRKSRVKAADLLTAEWSQRHNLWNATIITALRKQWLDCEILTNVPIASLVTGPKSEDLRMLFERRPADIVVVGPERNIEIIYLLAIKNEVDRKRASQLRTILQQAGYQVSLIDKDKLQEIEDQVDA